jgi:hypothetical protein
MPDCRPMRPQKLLRGSDVPAAQHLCTAYRCGGVSAVTTICQELLCAKLSRPYP